MRQEDMRMEQAAGTEFRRALGPWSAGALVAGSIIGTGIFIFVYPVAAKLPSRGAILGAWIVGAMVASCGALSLAELASAYPQTGGIYVFLRRAYGPPVAFLYSWAKFLIMRPGTLAILVLAFSGFFIEFFGIDTKSLPWINRAIAIGAVVILTVINIIGVRAGGGVQAVLTAIKLLCLAAIVAVGAAFAVGMLESHPVEIEPAEPPGELSILLFGAALIPVMWTFGGWDESPFVAEEVRNPERNLVISILGGLWVVAALFVLVNAAYLAILSPAELAGSGMSTAPLAMRRALGSGAEKLIGLALIISTFGAANGYVLTGGRIAYATGRDQALFRWFGHSNSRTKTPARALVVQAGLATATILLFEDPFQLLLYTGLAYWLFSALTAAAVIVLRKRDPQRRRPFRVWGYPVVPVLFVAASLGMARSVIVENPVNALITVAILGVGGLALIVGRVIFGE